MRATCIALLFLVIGCTTPTTIPIKTTTYRVGVVTTGGLTSVTHGQLQVGDLVSVYLRGRWRPAIVIRKFHHTIWIEGYGEELDIQRGDSGSPVVRGLVEAGMNPN